ncbi:MAG: hypothetical protein RL275_2812 [Chloroflexota bacterium]
MEPNYVIGGIVFVCLIGMSVLFIMVIPTRESILNWLLWKNIEHRESEEQKYLIELAERGEIAPATILSVNATGQHRKQGNNARSRVVYEVEVMPEGQPSFRQTFELWIPVSYSSRARGGGHYGVFDAIEAEIADPKIWVTYDPNDPSQMTLHHRDKDHDVAMRMREFNKITKGNEALKQTGESAEALITRVEDLDLYYSTKKSKAMRIEFMVTPNSGPSFEAGGHFLIGDAAIQKYSVGKKVFVRFDPSNPAKAVLDSERNKSLK